MPRCLWAGDSEPYVSYHDQEWGVPLHDDQKLFEMLILEGAQAGLSWITVLKKRPHYQQVFDRFDAHQIVRYDEQKIQSLLADKGIIRNKLKIASVITNARVYLDILDQQGSFDQYIWQFVDGEPITNRFRVMEEVPAKTPISDVMSKTLKKVGFKFVGSTICYAYMQAVGMVNDHTTDCFRWIECQ
ncbi:MAG: DNA-3-methyladenine glycosylase I [Saprospiraceae bacterium]|nr:DNA-3-methyladenine glycosylase I [Saprospiraceae bacterium]